MMKELYFENQGTSTYLVCEIAEQDTLDTMSLGMLTNNKIPSLATTLFTQMNNNKYIKYNVSSKLSVKQFFSGQVNKQRLLGVFSGIIDAMLSADDYMLTPESIILDLDYIFVDVSTCETILICLPVIDEEAEFVNMKEFFRNIMFNTKFDQNENCDHVAKLINYLNGTPMFSLEEFKKIIDECRGNPIQQEVAATQSVKIKPTVTSAAASQQASVQTVSVQHVVQQPVTPPMASAQSVSQSAAQPMIQPFARPASGMPIPPKMQKSTSVPASKTSEQKDSQEDISLFYLLQHYNKDNAAAYKAQKVAKKEGKAEPKPEKSSKKKATPAGNQNLGFAIPGQATIPSQSGLQLEVPQANSAPVSATPTSQSAVQQPQPVVTSTVAQPQVVSKAANFGNTTVLNVPQNGATTVLDPSLVPGMGGTPKPYLIRKKNSETIPINKDEFRLGKERSFVDYFIGDNTAISRSHACIVCRENEYFVMDTNSTNHTFVNDIMIQSNVETKLESGTKIRLADEEFEFKMM